MEITILFFLPFSHATLFSNEKIETNRPACVSVTILDKFGICLPNYVLENTFQNKFLLQNFSLYTLKLTFQGQNWIFGGLKRGVGVRREIFEIKWLTS
jgi:hypothetical protein